jgi:hypothetical protein
MKMIIIISFPVFQVMEHIWNETDRGKPKYSEKHVPVPLSPPQIPHGPTRDQTRASAVRGRRLIAWAMTRPRKLLTDFVTFNFGVMRRCSILPKIFNFIFSWLLNGEFLHHIKTGGRQSAITWPTRSPDLTLCFYSVPRLRCLLVPQNKA